MPGLNGFATTRWSQVTAAGTGARAALAWLCSAYWEALRAHVRRRGYSATDAEDLTQDFLVQVLQGGLIERADRERGRFRTFLLACLDHHLSHARERAAALKRGGTVQHCSSDAPAPLQDGDAAFDRDWAMTMLARAGDRLRRDSGDPQRHDVLACYLTRNGDAQAYAILATQLEMEVGAVRVAVHRLRTSFADCLRQEVAETLCDANPAAIEAEISDLLAALRQDIR